MDLVLVGTHWFTSSKTSEMRSAPEPATFKVEGLMVM